MSKTKAKEKPNGQKKKQPWTVFDINIKVFSDGTINIDAPKDLAIFHEIITQAERIMIENYGPKKTDGIRKLVRLNPKIELVRK